jgi:hypothetical protein
VVLQENVLEFAAKLAAAVQEEQSLFSVQARCFLPGVGFRLWRGKESVDVIVCYLCTGLRLVAPDAEGKVLGRAGGGFSANWSCWSASPKRRFRMIQ